MLQESETLPLHRAVLEEVRREQMDMFHLFY
jgi:hypothetical protein